MNVSSAAFERQESRLPTVSLRGTKRGLEIVIESGATAEQISRELRARLAQSPEFFCGSDVVVRCEDPLPVGALARLDAITSRYALRIVEVGPAPRPEPPRAPPLPPPPLPAMSTLPLPAPAQTRVLAGPVRSGTILEVPEHLVVLGDVNPGAELRAGKSVIVLGALRGIAHAGMGGVDSFILALRLAPQQLRIGDLIARAGDAPAARAAEIAYRAADRILVEEYQGKLPGGFRVAGL